MSRSSTSTNIARLHRMLDICEDDIRQYEWSGRNPTALTESRRLKESLLSDLHQCLELERAGPGEDIRVGHSGRDSMYCGGRGSGYSRSPRWTASPDRYRVSPGAYGASVSWADEGYFGSVRDRNEYPSFGEYAEDDRPYSSDGSSIGDGRTYRSHSGRSSTPEWERRSSFAGEPSGRARRSSFGSEYGDEGVRNYEDRGRGAFNGSPAAGRGYGGGLHRTAERDRTAPWSDQAGARSGGGQYAGPEPSRKAAEESIWPDEISEPKTP